MLAFQHSSPYLREVVICKSGKKWSVP